MKLPLALILVVALGAATTALVEFLLREEHREAALATLESRDDTVLVQDVASSLALLIEAEDGTQVLKAMRASFPHAALHTAYTYLAGRDPGPLADDYRTTLENADLVAHRKDLIAALARLEREAKMTPETMKTIEKLRRRIAGSR